MTPIKSYTKLREKLAELKEYHRQAIARELTDSTDDERAKRLKESVSFGFVGKDEAEIRVKWIELSCDETENPSEGTGYYVLINGAWDDGPPVLMARHRDPRDREDRPERTAAEAEERARRNTLEHAALSEERAHRAKDAALSRVDELEKALRAKDDNLRSANDRIAVVERERDDGGALGMIFATALPYIDDALKLFKSHNERAEKKDRMSKKTAHAFEMLSKLAAAVNAAPGASTVMRDRNVRQVIREIQDELGDEGAEEEAEPEPEDETEPEEQK